LCGRGVIRWGLVLCLMVAPCLAGADSVERRRDQFGKDFSYFVYPIGGDIPGLGSAFGAGATVLNIAGSDADFTGFKVSGDFDAAGYTLLDVHLLPKRLLFDIGWYDFEVAPVQYRRGIESAKDDYILPKVQGSYWQSQVTLSFDERRIELYYRLGIGESRLLEVLDADGNAFPAIDTGWQDARFSTLGVTLDYTDDRIDPRRGSRFEIAGRMFHDDDPLRSDYLTMDYNLTGYVPARRIDTLALNLFYSRAHIIHQATTDFETLRTERGLECDQFPAGPDRDRCLVTETKLINDLVAQNTYGNATALGGTQRLRSFANGRYYAGQAVSYGIEYRWNLTDEYTPFDIFFAKGIRTGLQVAFFAEQGSVADHFSDLWKDRRTSYGTGFRVVLSGVVIRADYAAGDEGREFILFINYPWSMFSVDSPG
jgi:hypothetical protein